MAALNSSYSNGIGSHVIAALVLFSVAILACLLVVAITQNEVDVVWRQTRWFHFLAGLLLVFYVLSTSWVTPKLGLGLAISLVLMGQLIAASAIDHNGWFGVLKTAFTWHRALALCLFAVGIGLFQFSAQITR